MTKTVLIVAFDFLPSNAAAVQRILKLADYMKDFNWQPVILTATPSAYENIDEQQEVPQHLVNHIYRTKAWDVHRHLSIKGKHFNWMKAIDRWSTWIPGAINKGSQLLQQYKFDAILSTAPIPSAHIIAYNLAKKSQLPWLADYQDPMAYLYEKTSWLRKQCHQRIDTLVATHSAGVVFATEQAKDLFQTRYQHLNTRTKYYAIENGYDDTNFERLEKSSQTFPSPFASEKFSLYYSGILYPNGRNPLPLFQAIAQLHQQQKINSNNFEMIFQGTGDGLKFHAVLKDLQIANLVKFCPSTSFVNSLYNMTKADALVLIQDEVFNLQVPGKLFEYLRAQKPIIAITPENSATAGVAKPFNLTHICNTPETIASAIINCIQGENKPEESLDKIQQYSRYQKSISFINVLNEFAEHVKIS
jgi:hypothetical protein